MGKECSTTRMAINIAETSLTAYQKVTDSILGETVLPIVGISSKATEMDMEFG